MRLASSIVTFFVLMSLPVFGEERPNIVIVMADDHGYALTLKAVGGNATVTVCHSRTADLGSVTREAEILVVAMGRPEMIGPEMVASGAVVIDVGTNRVDDASRDRGYRVCGDVLFNEVAEVAGAISPVPGGVGPMTITMLLSNTVKAATLISS